MHPGCPAKVHTIRRGATGREANPLPAASALHPSPHRTVQTPAPNIGPEMLDFRSIENSSENSSGRATGPAEHSGPLVPF